MKISFQPEFNNLCLLDRYNDGDYLILIIMHHKIRWEVDYIFEAGIVPGFKHVRALVDNDKVQLSYVLERGFPQRLHDILEEQTNMLIRKVKKNKAFL